MEDCQRPHTASSDSTSSPVDVHPQQAAGFHDLDHGLSRGSLRRGAVVAAVFVLLLGTAWLVYMTGGTRYAVLHLAYIPIIVAGSLLGPWGGLAAGVTAGFLLGPFMPQDVSAGTMQQPVNWLLRSGFFVAGGLVAGVLMTAMRKQQARLRWFALHSPATGLPNEEALIKDISVNLSRRKADNRYTLLLVQIKNYEDTVDALGGRVGIEINKALANRLQHMRPRPEQVYDLRGDKIAVLLLERDGALEHYLRSLRRLPDTPVAIGNVPIYTDLTVGVVALGPGPLSPEDSVQRVNIALNRANQSGSFYVRYANEDDNARKRNVDLLARLPAAIRNEELLLEYQPKIDLQRGEVVGAEALVRWQHPQLGRIPPGDFIPLAERTALVHPLTQWVLREAVKYVAGLHRSGHALAVAVNISAKNFKEPELLGYIRDLIAEHQLPSGCVELEITESAILDSSPQLIDALVELRARGATISIDDFGTGYTSLSYLAELPVDCLKIDQVFVRRLLRDQRQRSIVASVIDLAQRLDLTTVAEGVEHQETADLLARMGCRVGQGFHFCRPLSPSALEKWLSR
jgi:EAL domain-containing protein (putative c-di-GMP-specific phosphodiesterase class I)/GGDEF domain-containing protein